MPPRSPKTTVVAVLLLLASACAHGASSRDKETAVVHADLGAEAIRGGRSQESLKSYDEALKLDPDLAEAHMGRGVVLELAFGRLDEAEAEYRKAILLKPGLAEAHNNLGQLLAKTGRLEEAVKEFDTAASIMLYREPWVARCNKGQALYRMGKKDDGLREFRTCLTIAPRYCAGHRELGLIHLGDGRLKEALDELGTYAHDCDKAVDAHLQLGLVRMRMGDLTGAKESFQQCLALSRGAPSGDECRRRLERLE